MARKQKKTGGKYRKTVAKQIQPAIPRPLKSQLVRFCWQNRVYLKPTLVGTQQPAVGFTVAVNRPHNMLESKSFVGGTMDGVWAAALDTDGTMPHLSSWADLYEHYLVRGCKVSVTFRTEGNSTTSDRSGKLCIIKHGKASDVNQYSSYDNILNTCPNFKVANISASTTTMNQARLSMGYAPAQYHGINKKAISANPQLKGKFKYGGGFEVPEEDAFISVAYTSPFAHATTGAFNMPEGLLEVKIEQVLQLTDVKQSTLQQPTML